MILTIKIINNKQELIENNPDNRNSNNNDHDRDHENDGDNEQNMRGHGSKKR